MSSSRINSPHAPKKTSSSVTAAIPLGLIATLALGVAGAGCGGSGSGADGGGGGGNGGSQTGTGVVSCAIAESSGGVSTNFTCEEVSASLRAQLQASCRGPDAGVSADAGFAVTAGFAEGPCTHVGALGGCRVTAGGFTETIWYYAGAGFTTATVQQACTGTGAFVAP